MTSWITISDAEEIEKMAKEEGKKEMLENVCEYIKENLYHAWINTNNGNTYRTQLTELFIKNLKKTMEE